MLKVLIVPIVLSFLTSGCAKPSPVENDQSACSTATARVAAARQLPITHVADCEAFSDANLPGYFVVALRGHCREELCGSTLIGWFAVRKADGAAFELNVGDWKVGRPVSAQTFRE